MTLPSAWSNASTTLGTLSARARTQRSKVADADDLPVGHAHQLGDDAHVHDRRAAVEVHRLEVAQVGLQHVVGAQPIDSRATATILWLFSKESTMRVCTISGARSVHAVLE
jgi:hypothetical protein